MSTATQHPRTPAGTPAGGQFAPTLHPESAVSLTGPHAAVAEATGRCPICQGTDSNYHGARGTCPGCTGTGTITDADGWDRVARVEADCTITCVDCNGDGCGPEESTTCRTCDGAGTVTDYSLAE
ncbi:hypothetical protein [Nocardioides pakistanensis]